MARNRTAAISSLFDTLSRHASLRGSAIPPPPIGAYRTIYGSTEQVERLTNMVCIQRFRASAHLAMGVFRHNNDDFVGVMGFDFEPELPELGAVDVGPGAGVVLLTEFQAAPCVSALTIVNAVGEISSADHGYIGHDFDDIRALFPSLQLFEMLPGPISESPWPLLLKAAVSEAAQGGSWVGPVLQDAVSDLAGLEAPAFPYSALCRAIFDLDPRSLFMALYRCVEATYARDACEKLRVELGIDTPWYEIATKLDRALGWRAPEAASINNTLKHADRLDLAAICRCLGIDEADDMSIPAGRAIYRLRNKIVHFRAGDDQDYAAELDWELLCTHMAFVVREVYGAAFTSTEISTE